MDAPKKKRGNLDKLNPTDQDLIFSHCNPAGTTLAQGVLWIKDTFNVKISENRLSVWLRHRRVELSNAARLESLRNTRDSAILIGKVVGSATGITVANSVLISQAIFEQLSLPEEERDEKRLTSYMQLALKARDQEIRESSLALQTDRFQFDAAAAALKKAGDLQQINQTGGDELAKVEAAIKVLFGERPAVTDFREEAA